MTVTKKIENLLLFSYFYLQIHPKVGVKYNRTLNPLRGIYTSKGIYLPNNLTFGHFCLSRELEQPLRLRQVRRCLKINICAMGTILLLLPCSRILYC